MNGIAMLGIAFLLGVSLPFWLLRAKTKRSPGHGYDGCFLNFILLNLTLLTLLLCYWSL